jgi:hypothetical protein
MEKLILAVILAVIQATPPPSASQHVKETSKTQQIQEPEAPKTNPAPNPLSTKNVLYSRPSEVSRQGQGNNPAYDPHTWLDRLNGFSTLVIAIFAVLTCIAVAYQVKTARRTDRAWMVTFEPEILFDGATSNVFYRCKITNIGRTPSRIVETGIGFGTATDLSQLPSPPAYTERIQYNRIVVAPDDSISMRIELCPPLSREDAQSIQAGKLFLYAYGFVRYLDVFGSRKRHTKETRFCHCSDTRLSLRYANEYPSRPCIEAPSEYHWAT